MENNLSVALLGIGSTRWIAGRQLILSIVHANALLPEDHRLDIRLLLPRESDGASNGTPEGLPATSVDWFDNRSRSSLRLIWDVGRSLFNVRRGIDASSATHKSILTSLLRQSPSVVFPANNHVGGMPPSSKAVSWIPDFQHLHFPEHFPATHRAYRTLSFRRILKLSDLVVVSNEYSKRDAVDLVPESSKRVKVVPFCMWLGADWHKQDWQSVLSKYKLPKKYLMFPSQFWIHKNHKRLFQALAQVIRDGHSDAVLVCTGSLADHRYPAYHDELISLIQKSNIEQNVRILGLIPRADQVQLMRGAAALVQPSLFEGRSALLDEGQSLGKRIFVSDTPMHREQKPPDATFFNPYDTCDIAEKLAADWPDLSPGPDAEAESIAFDAYRRRAVAYAVQLKDHFLSIV